MSSGRSSKQKASLLYLTGEEFILFPINAAMLYLLFQDSCLELGNNYRTVFILNEMY